MTKVSTKADITPPVEPDPEYPDEYKPLYIPTRLIKLNRITNEEKEG